MGVGNIVGDFIQTAEGSERTQCMRLQFLGLRGIWYPQVGVRVMGDGRQAYLSGRLDQRRLPTRYGMGPGSRDWSVVPGSSRPAPVKDRHCVHRDVGQTPNCYIGRSD
jgi:hypothetical protein